MTAYNINVLTLPLHLISVSFEFLWQATSIVLVVVRFVDIEDFRLVFAQSALKVKPLV